MRTKDCSVGDLRRASQIVVTFKGVETRLHSTAHVCKADDLATKIGPSLEVEAKTQQELDEFVKLVKSIHP